ncbi:MAG TPA: endonuclease III [Tepidisphaeraceae bacterium]|nr:endonuclease III [Tepidisphaeraceae bacterium]
MSKAPSKKVLERRQRVERYILPILKQTYPDAHCRLDHTNPLELLVATILSAQCTDDRVNFVTKTLFKKYRKAEDYARVAPEALQKDIQSTGFYRNKAKSLRGMAADLVAKHQGKVPRTMDELTALPGVGRKTANVVLGNAYHENIGIVVDTHVTRVSNRLGLTDNAVDAVKIEKDLMQVVPQEDWTLWSHLLIHHGRALCKAPKPKCDQCPLLPHCPAGPKFIAGEKKKKKK